MMEGKKRNGKGKKEKFQKKAKGRGKSNRRNNALIKTK
jgi:hypothetical protein